MNRQKRRARVAKRAEISLKDWIKLSWNCGWSGCTEKHFGDHVPEGWRCLVVYSGRTVLDLTKVKKWHHDKVICPAHARMLDEMLYPGADEFESLDETAGEA